MKLLRGVFDFYLDASVHVALAIFSLVLTTTILLNIPVDWHLTYFILFGSIASYNFIKYGAEAEKYILVANRYHKNIQWFSFMALVIAIYHAFYLSLQLWIGVGVLLLLTGLYALPVLPQTKNLRSLGLVKILLVALVWAGTTVILPVIAVQEEVSCDVSIEAIQRFLMTLVLILPFEIRDLKYDKIQLKTFPQRYGYLNTKVFGIVISFVLFGLTFLKDSLSHLEIIGKGFLLLLLIFILLITKRDQRKYFASFWVEAIPIFWLAILWVQ